MGAIDVGAAAIDRASTIGAGFTRVAKDNPANDTGVLSEIQIYANAEIFVLQVGTFTHEGSDVMSTTDTEAVAGSYAAGYHEIAVDLDITSGDYIGFYFNAGWLDYTIGGGAGIWYKNGDYIPCTSETFGALADRTFSLYGIGATANGAAPSPSSSSSIDMITSGMI